jgi:hypothetical protein
MSTRSKAYAGFGNVIVNSGAQGTKIAEKSYKKIDCSRLATLELNIQYLVLLNDFGEKSKRLKK